MPESANQGHGLLETSKQVCLSKLELNSARHWLSKSRIEHR